MFDNLREKAKGYAEFFCLLNTLKVMNENEFWDQYVFLNAHEPFQTLEPS